MADKTHGAKCTETVCSGACREWPVAERKAAPAESAARESVHGPVAHETTREGSVRTVLDVPGMDCPTEEAMIRNRLSGMPGIEAIDCNFLERRLTLTTLPDTTAEAVGAIEALGLGATVRDDSVVPGQTAGREGVTPAPVVSRRAWILLAVAAVAAFSAEALHLVLADGFWLVVGLSLFAVALGGLETYWKGLLALKNRTLNINALMTIAVTGAMAIGEWPEAAMVMVLFALAEHIEELSLDRARHAIRSLLAMTPETATVRREDGTWIDIEAKKVAVGVVVRVRPGERIPLDGEVIEGVSAVNQAPITGESMPVEKGPGAQVFAGTINTTGSFQFRVTKAAGDTTLAHIIHAVEEAQTGRAPTQRFVDRFAGVYTPLILSLAILVALIPPLVLGQSFLAWIYRALVLLVIGCPCALVISTPVTVVSGLATAARRGILIKGGAYLEQGRKLKVVAFDKTGTITEGEPSVTDFLPQGGEETRRSLSCAAALAVRSDHPLSQAIAAYAREAAVSPPELSEFVALPGRGTKGRLNDEWLYLGSHRLIDDLNVCHPELEELFTALESQGKSVVILADGQGVLAVFGVADAVRVGSREAVADLHSLGLRTVVLSGDNQQTVAAIAEQVGIEDARGGLLPEEKLAAITDLVGTYDQVGMAGDGINDAPALAAASIGFAMGAAGSDTALEVADVALMDDDLRRLPYFIRLSRRTAVILAENIGLALGVKAVFFGLAFVGEATLWMAVVADMGVGLLVVFNGLRLLRWGGRRTA